MSEVNKIANYNQMMSWLTRPSTPKTETRENFAEAGYVKPATKAQEAEALKKFKKPFNELDPQRRSRIRTDSYSDKEIGSWKKSPITKTQEKIAQKIYGQPFEELSKDRKTRIRTGKTTLESGKNPIDLMPTEKRVQYTKDRAINFVKNFKKEKGRKPSLTEMRKMGKFDYQTIKNFTKEGIIDIQKLGESRGLKNPQTKIIDDDLRLLNNNQYIKDSFKKGEVPDFNTVAKILKTNDKGIVGYRVSQLASAYLGDRKVEGIKPSYKKGAELILDTAKDIYTPAMRRLADLKIGKSVGEKSTATTRGNIRYHTPEGFGETYAIDEPGGTISSVRRGSTPYGAFGQIIKSDLNKQTKYEFDRKKSIDEKSLQNAIATGDKKKINEAVKKFNNNVSEYETKLNKDVKPGQPKIKLFKVSLNNPKQTIANYSKLSKDYQNAFQKNYKTKGYSFKVPSDIKPLSQIAEDVKNPKVMSGILKKAEMGAPRVFSKLLPGLEQIAQGIKNIPDDIKKKKFFTLGLKALGPLGTYIAVDDTYEALKAGRPVAEALEYGLIGTNLIGSAKDLMALSPEEREARSVVKQAEMADQIAQDESMLDSDFETPKVKSDLTREEAEEKFEAAKARRKLERESQEADIAKARAISMSGLKDLITGKRFAGQEMPTQYMAAGGRIGFADGPDDPSRRKFMKIAGGIASIPLVGKYLKPAMVAAPKVVEVVKRSADGIPDFIGDLITKVVTLGKKSFSGNRADELEEVYQLDNYVVTKQGEKTRVKKVDDQGEFGYKEHEMELEMDPETGGVTYNEASVRPDAEGKLKDVEEFIDDVDLEDMKKYTYDE